MVVRTRGSSRIGAVPGGPPEEPYVDLPGRRCFNLVLSSPGSGSTSVRGHVFYLSCLRLRGNLRSSDVYVLLRSFRKHVWCGGGVGPSDGQPGRVVTECVRPESLESVVRW